MVCFELNIVFTAEIAESMFFSFAGDLPKIPVDRKAGK
jgi:hypothetical protein